MNSIKNMFVLLLHVIIFNLIFYFFLLLQNHSKYILISSADDLSLFDSLVEKNIRKYLLKFKKKGFSKIFSI